MAPLRIRCPACYVAWPLALSELVDERTDCQLACPSCGHVLSLKGGILELDELPGLPEYPAELAASDAALDGEHWWYASRNAVILSVLHRWQRSRGRAGLAFDLGCGSGYVLAAIESEGWSGVGLDMQRAGLEVARRRVAGVLLRSGRPLVPLADPIDLALLCDVLEHADEAELLGPLRESLAPDGALLLTVPARPSLWSLEDVAVGHHRRYTINSLRQTLRTQGYRVIHCRSFHTWLTPLAWRAARRSGALPERAEALQTFLASRRVPSAKAAKVCARLCALENGIERWLPLPFGSHLVALAERA